MDWCARTRPDLYSEGVPSTSRVVGCYPGRLPHAHFEVYPSLELAAAGSSPLKTSQLALPQGDCENVYADSRYGSQSPEYRRAVTRF